MNSRYNYHSLEDVSLEIKKPVREQKASSKEYNLHSMLDILQNREFRISRSMKVNWLANALLSIPTSISWGTYKWIASKASSSWAEAIISCGYNATTSICYRLGKNSTDDNFSSCDKFWDACDDYDSKRELLTCAITLASLMGGYLFYNLVNLFESRNYKKDDLVKDKYKPHEIAILEEFGIKGDMPIHQAVATIESLIQYVTGFPEYLPKTVWGIVEQYLAPAKLTPANANFLEQLGYSARKHYQSHNLFARSDDNLVQLEKAINNESEVEQNGDALMIVRALKLQK